MSKLQGAQRFTICFDPHGDRIDLDARRAFFEFVKWWKPEVRIHGGDNWDFRALRKGASDEDKRGDIAVDKDAGCDFLSEYRPDYFLLGNHDIRLWDLLLSDNKALIGLAREFKRDIDEAIGKAMVLPYDKRHGLLKLGHFKAVHGYHSGITAARQAGLVYGSVHMGHTHTIDQYSVAGLERKVSRVCGCLCQLDQDYNRAQPQTLRQAHGWGYGLLLKGGDYVYWQAEKVGGAWYYPSEIRCSR